MKIEKTSFVTEADSIRQICEPLKLIGIDNFFYMRVYDDSTIIDFATHVDWGVHFFSQLEQHFYNQAEVRNHFYSTTPTTLWQDYPDNLIWKEGRDYFNVGNGITLIRRSENFNESFSFFSKKDNHEINDFYLKNIGALEKFLSYFKEKARRLILQAETNKLTVPTFYRPKTTNESNTTSKKSVSDFVQAISNKNTIKNFSALTPKECECLYWLAQGKTAEETGIILSASRRTIEHHLNNIKTKTDTYKITTLIYHATRQGLI